MWDERYDTDEYVYGTEPNGFLAEKWTTISGDAVLSLAEGEGRNAVFLAEKGFTVTGVDGSAVGLRKAKALASRRGVTLRTIVHDLNTFQISPDSWDGIVSIFNHLPHDVRKIVHARVVRGLRPGGVYILESYTPKQLSYDTGGPKTADRLPTLEQLRAELAGLNFEHGVETERIVTEGTLHTGRAAVVQIIARKPG